MARLATETTENRERPATRPRRRATSIVWTATFLVTAALGVGGSAAPAFAQQAGSAQAQEDAQVHFRRAKELYAAGSYREAASELEAAQALDPKAKDLYFNLGVVFERLGRIDDALGEFRQYQQMDLTAAERSRAEATVRRLEGAKRAQDNGGTAPTASPAATGPTTTAAPTPAPTTGATDSATPSPAPAPTDTAPTTTSKHGRLDAATVAAGGIGVAGLAVGTVFGIMALGKNPKSYETGSGHSYSDYLDAKSSAHTDATVSTVGMAVGVAGVAVAAVLYFARSADANASADRGVGVGIGRNGAVLGGRF